MRIEIFFISQIKYLHLYYQENVDKLVCKFIHIVGKNFSLAFFFRKNAMKHSIFIIDDEKTEEPRF